ncbi:unnamed protein product [Phyllotreta striolata]|uniref:Odorant receptor n=1 Tax=Phyllotreta striolata TaxID=444603 RepID=A0A9N9TNS5_PHYSR|nr:unnamed protein product [Phyllotreta striolata]
MYHENLNWCLKVYTFLGVHPRKKGIFRTIHYVFNVSCPFVITSLTLIMLHLNRPFNIEYLGEASTALTTFPHAIMKLTTLFLQQSKIIDLLERTRSQFWTVDDDNVEIKRAKRIGKVLKNAYFYSVAFFMFTTILKTILTHDLAYRCYQPKWIPKTLLIIYQDYTCCVILFTLMSFDIMFQTLLFQTQLQFKMLNKKYKHLFDYENLGPTALKSMLKECVDHQSFLIDFVNRIKDTFSLSLLLFVGNIIVSLCMSVYIILSDNSKLNLKIEAVVHTIAGLNEIGLCYSIPAQMFMDEAAEIRNSIYFSNWYQRPRLAKEIIPLLIREQKPLTITAGGFVMIDLQMFLVACKTILSYSMFLNTITQLQ